MRPHKPARTRFWQVSLLAAASVGAGAWLLAPGLTQPKPLEQAICATAPCVVATLPPAEVVLQVPPGSLPGAFPAEGQDMPTTNLEGGAPPAATPASTPLPGEGLAVPPEAAIVALAPLAEVEVAKRPEPKKPRDILLPGEVMRPERQNAAPTMGAYRPRTATTPAPAPASLKPLRPAEKAPPRPYTVTTTRPTGAVGIRLGPCGPTVPRYQVDGVEVDAFGRPCGPS
jgi:hypothetical protein